MAESLKNIFNEKKNNFLVLGIVSMLAIIVCLFIRIRYGIEMDDEAWYVAEPYLAAKGAVPYYDSWSQSPGFVWPVFVLYKLFLLINGGTEGIVLFSRIIYVIWASLLIIFAYKVCKTTPLILFLPLLATSISGMYAISYNSIGLYYSTLVLLILFFREDEEKSKENIVLWNVAGVLMGLSIIGTPLSILFLIISAIILIASKKYNKLLYFITGLAGIAVIVVAYCAIFGGGIGGIINGLKCTLADGTYWKIEKKFILKDSIKNQIYSFSGMMKCFILLVINWLFLRKKKVYKGMTLFILSVFFIYGLYCGIADKTFLARMVYYCSFEGVFSFIFLGKGGKRWEIFLISAMNFIMYFVSSVTNVWGFAGRQYLLIISGMLSLFSLYYGIKDIISDPLSDNIAGKLKHVAVLPIVICVIMVITIINFNFTFVYRDADISQLTEKVESGIWKGIYTTPERKTEVAFYEDTIREYTEPGEKVLFMDWVSFAYLMSDGEAFTPSTLDNMCYSYYTNDDSIMKDYFELKGAIPDKIIYVDFGRDEHLSIEEDGWKFNSFVQENYENTAQNEWEGHRVILYSKKGF